MSSTNTEGSADARRARYERSTSEVRVRVEVDLDGSGATEIDTGIAFLDHMWTALARHARIDLALQCEGDLEVDDHHTAEDSAIGVGRALSQALGERRGIRRFGSAYAPLDEALARAVVDLSGRPWPQVELGLRREWLGKLSCENVGHVLRTLAVELGAAVHVDVLRGENDHHRAEAAFKALALALRAAVEREADGRVPSTKGVLR